MDGDAAGAGAARAASADAQSMLPQPSGGRADFERKLLFEKAGPSGGHPGPLNCCRCLHPAVLAPPAACPGGVQQVQCRPQLVSALHGHAGRQW